MARWGVPDLTTLARARARGLTYPQIHEEHFPDRTVASLRSAAQTKTYKEIAQGIEDEPHTFLPEDGPDRFVFEHIGVEFDVDTFCDLVRAYVRAGRDQTRAEVARDFDLTAKQMDHICNVYGLTKGSPPVPREILARTSDEEIVERTLQAREKKLIDRVDRRRSKYFERKYSKLVKKVRERETALQRLDAFLEERSDLFGARPVQKLHNAKGLYRGAVHVPTADLHLGKLSWAPEVGSNYDSDIGANRLMAHGGWVRERLFRRQDVFGMPGCKTAYVTDVGDFFHAIMSQTESGTALDKDTRDLRIFDLAFEAKVQQIDKIREAAEQVVIITVPGNHDHIFVPLFSRMLALHYRDVADVEVRSVYGRFAGFVVGHTAHLLDHGKGVNSLTGWKSKAQMWSVLEQAIPDEDMSRVRNLVYYCGHKHSLQVETYTSMELRRLLPMCDADDFETGLRYGNSPGAELFHLDADGQIERIDRFRPHIHTEEGVA